jgi:DNA-binding LacI/PurR family transcriptional regulator
MASATIRDVARLASVGIATVSRVLNGSPAVSEATRQKVLEAIEALDYTPNPIARRLSLGRTLTIAVIVPFFTRPSFVERLRGVEQTLANSEYDLVLYNVESITQRDIYFKTLPRRERVDGLLIISLSPDDDQVKRFLDSEVPTVLVDAYHPLLSRAIIDDVSGGYLATQCLIELGHRKIAYLSDYLENPFNFVSSRYRYEGYRRALKDAQIPFRPEYHQQGEHGRLEAYHMAKQLLTLPDRPTAIFAASDTQAIGVLEAAQELGLNVPQDLSVIGYDDIEVAEYLNLTTIRQPLFDSGMAGVNILLNALETPQEEPQEVILPISIVERQTTAPPGS